MNIDYDELIDYIYDEVGDDPDDIIQYIQDGDYIQQINLLYYDNKERYEWYDSELIYDFVEDQDYSYQEHNQFIRQQKLQRIV